VFISLEEAKVASKKLEVASKVDSRRKSVGRSNPHDEIHFIPNTPVSQLLQLQQTIGNRAVHQLMRFGALQLFQGLNAQENNRIQIQAVDNIKNEITENMSVQAREESNEVRTEKYAEENLQKYREEEVKTQSSVGLVQFTVATQTNQYGSPEVLNAIREQRGQGEPLEPKLRFTLERSMGTDFNSVRVHRDATAAQINSMLSARAFTNRDDIYFNQSQYNPDSPGGQHLIAHELAHVVQQRNIPDLQF